MANYNTLISAIQAVITQNGNNEITGNILQQTLVAMIGALGGGYQFAGIATPETTPETPDEKIFYLGSSGTYPNFGPAVIPSGNMGVFWYDTSWHVGMVPFPIGDGTIVKTNLSSGLLNELLAGYVYAGKATPTGSPGTIIRDSFFLTTTSGTYTNYGNISVTDGEIAVLRYNITNNRWDKESIAIPEMLEVVNNLTDGGTDKALSAEMGKVLYNLFGSGYANIDFFVNSQNVLWETGNVSNGSIVTTYQNRLIVLPLTNEIKAAGRLTLKFGPSPTYNLGALVSQNERSGYTTTVATLMAANIEQTADIILPNYANYLLLLVWDKPSDTAVKSLSISLTYQKYVENNRVLRLSDLDFISETEEDGFFVVDKNLNVGFLVDETGIKPAANKGNPSSVFIAAQDSGIYDKLRADYICPGYHDEYVIQQALNSLSDCGEIILARGTYMIDGFSTAADGHLSAIIIPDNYRPNYRIKIAGAQDSDRNCILKLSQNCYNNLNSDTVYSIISATNHVFGDYGKHAIFQNINIELPANKKKIICFDGWNFGSVRFVNCWANNAEAGNYLNSNLPASFYGVMECIGFRGTQGSNNAIDMLWTNCTAQGLGIGFAVSGEHLIMTQCAGVACKYGYTFNNYNQDTGSYNHPMTLINCCDERNENLPYFGKNGAPGHSPGHQAITFIDFNIERLATDAIVDLAKEETPGIWRGTLEYTFQAAYGNAGNSTDKAFWTNGHGQGIKSRNQAQLLAASTSIRNGYAPNYYQQIFDTTLNKLAICIDPANKTWVDVNGNII